MLRFNASIQQGKADALAAVNSLRHSLRGQQESLVAVLLHHGFTTGPFREIQPLGLCVDRRACVRDARLCVTLVILR